MKFTDLSVCIAYFDNSGRYEPRRILSALYAARKRKEMSYDFTGNMTRISRSAFEAATTLNLNAEEAKKILLSIPPRNFPDVLYKLVPELTPKMIEDGLCCNDTNRDRSSMKSKIDNWFDGVNYPTKREDLFELCFVLKMTIEKADYFLSTFADEGIHWRNPHEIIYSYALKKKMSYKEAQEFEKEITPQGGWKSNKDNTDSYTYNLKNEVSQIETLEELKLFIRDTTNQLGTLHNTAYAYFSKMLQMLMSPQGIVVNIDEDKYTVKDVVKRYFEKPELDKRNSTIKEILSNWPDNTTISRIKNRGKDVTRKLLLLLFLATDGAEMMTENMEDELYDDEFFEENDADEAFRMSYLRINQMMAQCGYRKLDPRNPMDWVAIYCMRITDDPDDMRGLDERMQEMMKALKTLGDEREGI